MSNTHATLEQPLQLGDISLKNRVVMAPLTRARSGTSRVPNALMKDYYVQRANAGLILTEATVIDAKAVGYCRHPRTLERGTGRGMARYCASGACTRFENGGATVACGAYFTSPTCWMVTRPLPRVPSLPRVKSVCYARNVPFQPRVH